MVYKLLLVLFFIHLPLNFTALASTDSSQIEIRRFKETCFAIKELLDWWLPIKKNEILKLINGTSSANNQKVSDETLEIFRAEFKLLEENFDYCFVAETEFPEVEKLDEIYQHFVESSEGMRAILLDNGFKEVEVDTRINIIKTNYNDFNPVISD